MRLVALFIFFLSLFLHADGQAYARAYHSNARYTGFHQAEKSDPVISAFTNLKHTSVKTNIQKSDAGDLTFEEAEEDYSDVLNTRWLFLNTVVVAFFFAARTLHRVKKIAFSFILPVYQYYIRLRVIKI